MSPLAFDLDRLLSQLDSDRRVAERARCATGACAGRTPASAGRRSGCAVGIAAGDFEATAGSFANEVLECSRACHWKPANRDVLPRQSPAPIQGRGRLDVAPAAHEYTRWGRRGR